MRLRGPETRSAPGCRGWEEGPMGREEVLITFAVICSVISLLPASQSPRMSRSPFGGGRGGGAGRRRGSPEG